MQRLRILDNEILDKEVEKALASERKRVMYNMDNPDEKLKVMVNSFVKKTYVTPHKHGGGEGFPDKCEAFLIIRGTVAVLSFDDEGNITEINLLGEGSEEKAVMVPPRTWHCVVTVSDTASVFEVIDQVYDPKTHKEFAPWAPMEGDEGWEKYRDFLEESVRKKFNLNF